MRLLLALVLLPLLLARAQESNVLDVRMTSDELLELCRRDVTCAHRFFLVPATTEAAQLAPGAHDARLFTHLLSILLQTRGLDGVASAPSAAQAIYEAAPNQSWAWRAARASDAAWWMSSLRSASFCDGGATSSSNGAHQRYVLGLGCVCDEDGGLCDGVDAASFTWDYITFTVVVAIFAFVVVILVVQMPMERQKTRQILSDALNKMMLHHQTPVGLSSTAAVQTNPSVGALHYTLPSPALVSVARTTGSLTARGHPPPS
jgi:hypothetical protein